MTHPAVAYGITEVSMGTNCVRPEDSDVKKTGTVGRVFPHTTQKIVDPSDPSKVLPMGQRGEVLIASYGLFSGYYKQPAKTREALYIDNTGRRWFRSGDEGMFDPEGYCVITGRIKDIIIRGGENIYPTEIEQRLMQHESVVEACVVGLPDGRLGEVVAAFLRGEKEGGKKRRRPSDEEVRDWVREKLARQKAPRWVFWMGEQGLPGEFPKTGSGKYMKHVLREMGGRVLAESGEWRAKL